MKWLGAAAACLALAMAAGGQSREQDGLRTAEDFAGIRDRQARSLALFAEAGKVIRSPRCLNCHPVGDRPTQTDAMVPHMPAVTRGPDGMGAVAMRCTNCHRAGNFSVSRVPGDPAWHLAPVEMGWQGKSLGAICRQIRDPARNGGRSLKQIVDHMATDHLVGWAWRPGAGRSPAPGTQAEFGRLIAAWVASGAVCAAA
ncbi:Isoquinoline 1-oxidoreductase subunit [Sphingobium rhizovicinum]|uniref:Isoquinoline 1-oxidoreductase subunit n=1 Tax=Sphingobium rhizovicinum TaxID=432308 RepID=A0ABV7NMR5_9SPHN